ncbi:LOW QUALITY PROTEIN: hypothetical protein MAR_018647 [Mya arenaria]|uniref:Uncharacterized protein n=1 Tax=Mya arenaria TaxID=6604 RepID=A0ABY7EJV8_MYAAR|nr:LOW QUALITY PROTEIN: hypothetical protein MAR_018647 [Mya arenaria]
MFIYRSEEWGFVCIQLKRRKYIADDFVCSNVASRSFMNIQQSTYEIETKVSVAKEKESSRTNIHIIPFVTTKSSFYQRCVTRVGSQDLTNSKKRPAKSPVELVNSPVKKPWQSAIRTLYDIQPTPPTPAPRRTSNKVVITQADIHVDGDVTVEQLVRKMSADMHMLFTSLSERVDKLEATLEQRESSKVSQLLDKRINSELNRIRRDVDDRMDVFKETMRVDVSEEITELKAKVDSLADNRPASGNDIFRNIIIRGLAEIQNENTSKHAKDILKLHGITCESAEHKTSTNQFNPAIIVARVRSIEDKRKVMLKKPELQRNPHFNKVFIDHDLSYADRFMSRHFRAVLKALNNQGLTMKGSRVIRSRDGSVDISSRDGLQRPPQQDQRSDDRDFREAKLWRSRLCWWSRWSW